MKPDTTFYSCRLIHLLAGLIITSAGAAQTTVVTTAPAIRGTTVVIPGREYRRSGYHNFFWGKHYRKEWATPVRVNNFFLDTAKGGLTPTQEGGGRQSNTLRVKDKNGKEYVLRSVDKDFGRGLPETVRGTFISRVAKDQVSIGHPFTGITITPMIEAAGIYHTNPVIVFVPYQGALKEYNNKYGNQLYLFEERPDDDQSGTPNFGNSKNVIGSDKLLGHIYDDHDDRVDQVAFVRARLFDMVIGDWGRHPDNWRWASFKKDGETIYKPIPRDRDQSYTKIDGLYPGLAGSMKRELQGFNYTIRHVSKWNAPALPLDRMFLNELGRDVWIEQAKELQQVLTDSLISYSVHRMPPEMFAISGDEIIEKLKSRRDHLVHYATVEYNSLAKATDIVGTDKKEMFVVERLPDGGTKVDIFKVKDDRTESEPYYSRVFIKKETQEIRIYGLGKKDIVTIKGNYEKKGVKVRVIDPGDKDSIGFEGKGVHSRIHIYRGKKYEYDTAHLEKLTFNLKPLLTAPQYQVFDTDPLRLFPHTGLKIGIAANYNTQAYRKEKYEHIHHLSAYYGVLRGAFNIGYVGRFGHTVGKWDILLKARLDAPAVENYFGTGNSTVINNDTRNYYRTLSTREYASIGLARDTKSQHIEASVFYHTFKFHETNSHFIAEGPAVIDPAVFGTNNFAGIEVGYSCVHVNDRVYPTKGFSWNAGAGYTVNVAQTSKAFLSANSAAAVYLPLSRQFSIAIRAGGATLSGEADFFNLNKIGGGGDGEIRAYERERFYGKHTAYLNNNLRWLFNTHNYLFNGKAGLLAFYDVGRVWQPGESSNQWHGGYGFGVIAVPFNKYAFTGMYGISPEGNHLHFKVGLLF